MCTNYRPTSTEDIIEHFGVRVASDASWPSEAYKDYLAPIIRHDAGGGRVADLAGFGFVPRRHIPPHVKKWDTMNAKSETIGELRSFGKYWKAGQLCLVPMVGFYEYFYGDSGTEKPVRWRIGMADDAPFAVAGMWREWTEQDGSKTLAMTQITIDTTEHPLMRRFHRKEDPKRAIVIIPREEYDDWLACHDPEKARSFLRNYPAELMKAWPEPKPPRMP
ncbi:MAG TPA: SOS response-associated peptidase family protein [Noviherbaspirillum sp.]|nr:SOS response-associated peptidase family protein [Noviherbaspirillum sp.]